MKQFQRVKLDGSFAQGTKRTGKIVGHASYVKEATDGAELRSAYVVELDEGFYSQDTNTYVSLLVVAVENLEEE